ECTCVHARHRSVDGHPSGGRTVRARSDERAAQRDARSTKRIGETTDAHVALLDRFGGCNAPNIARATALRARPISTHLWLSDHLVCRLLLSKKTTHTTNPSGATPAT